MGTPVAGESPVLSVADLDMNVVTSDVSKSPDTRSGTLQEILDSVKTPGSRAVVEGLTGSAKSWFLAKALETSRRPIVVLTANPVTGETLLGDFRYFLKHSKLRLDTSFFPTWELLPYEPLSPYSEVAGERLEILSGLLDNKCPFLIVPVEACMQYLMPKDRLAGATHRVRKGEMIDRDFLELCLTDNGYSRCDLVEERGQYSVRGDILDLFPPSSLHPLRIEMFGDEVESIRHFDVNSQVSFEEVDQLKILPMRELCLSGKEVESGLDRILEFAREHESSRSYLNELVEKIKCLRKFSGMEWLAPFFFNSRQTLFDYLHPDTLIVLDEEESVMDKAEEFQALVEEQFQSGMEREEVVPLPEDLFLTADQMRQEIKERSSLVLNTLKLTDEVRFRVWNMNVKPVPSFQGKFEEFANMARQWAEEGWKVTIAAPTKGHVRRVNELLVEKEMSFPVELGQISSGFLLPPEKQIFVAEHEIFGRTHKHRYRRRPRSSSFQRGFQDLKVGDLLVHVDYGIGRYLGTRELKTGVGSGEFMVILYADDQKLYIPMDGLAYIQKYLGAGDTDPPLSRLGGTQWKRQKKKVQESIEEMAGELLKIYAGRQVSSGYRYSPDPVPMQDFADSFEYVETDDQLKAIEEVLGDLESDKPMDRLICGDVGYGKTEVAMRAAFKAVLDKKQVAVLVPTTILAQQHFHTFRERFKMYPVSIDMVSRFRSAKQQKDTLKRLREGKLDIIIGTHRLLSKDVQFCDLGLLIVDEEQRFGVRHKERLKKLRTTVDILTMSATPIPRTLHFSLMGVRDLSVIETPPSDRLAIKTYIRKFDESVIREAILREMDRGGQVYFVHNKVQNIHSIATMLRKIVPEVRIGIAHGQMQERMLESVMRQFIDKEIDLLLCTSIVESGLDIPSANTILINRADQFGLAQLYQLRGRVGRYRHQAYAYLLIPGTMSISEEARKRLFAIEEMSDLGAGFQLAARDLEIRGAGNMLGKDQSGNINTIGFDLYYKMVEEAVQALNGETVERPVETEVDLEFKGFISKEFIPDINQRLEIYRRLQLVADDEGLEALRKEMVDRYGNLPDAVQKLFAVMKIKIVCQTLHITHVKQRGDRLNLKISSSTPLDSQKLMSLLDKKMRLSSEYEIVLRLDNRGWKEDSDCIQHYLKKFLETLHDNG